jgi:hypothetical protein
MTIGRRNVIFSGAAAAVAYPFQHKRLAYEEQPSLVMSGQAAVLDRSVRLSLAYYNSWVFDVQTRRGGAQAFLVSSSPSDSMLTADALAEVTGAIQRAITALPAVASCQATPIDADLTPPWNSDGYPSLVFGDDWDIYGYNTTIEGPGVSQSWFAQQVTDVSDAVQSAFAGLAGVTGIRQSRGSCLAW